MCAALSHVSVTNLNCTAIVIYHRYLLFVLLHLFYYKFVYNLVKFCQFLKHVNDVMPHTMRSSGRLLSISYLLQYLI